MDMAKDIAEWRWDTYELPDSTPDKRCRVGGASMRKLITAILELALKYNTTTPYLSQHFLEEYAGMDRKTVRKTLQGLQHLQWIKLLRKGKGMKAHTYRLLVGHPRLNPPYLSPLGGCTDYGGTKRVGHDVFQRGGGVGDAGRRLLSIMSTIEGGSVKELSGFAVVNEGYARKVLQRMQAVGLARSERRLWYSTDADLDEVARAIGTAGRGAARTVKNDIRRATQQNNIEKWKGEEDRKKGINSMKKAIDGLKRNSEQYAPVALSVLHRAHTSDPQP